MSIPKLSVNNLNAEIGHVSILGKLLDSGWTLTGLRIVEDPKDSTKGMVFTLFPDEQEKVCAVLKEIALERADLLLEQKSEGKV